jgi:three-Cys-motif partner protein
MPRDLHRKPFNEGTLLKLELFRKYIDAWLAVFVGSGRVTKQRIRIFDLFCGPGQDSNGQKGSPILILEALQRLDAMIKQVGYQVDVYFNDADADKITELRETLTSAGLMAGPYKPHFSNKDFIQAFKELRPQMLDSANLLLLDQNGVRFFTAGIFHQIRTLPITDTLVFMSASYVLRFKDEPEINRYLEAEKIFVGKAPAYHQVHRAIVDYYRSLVPAPAQYLLAPFSIRSGSNIHGLIFGSQNLKGLQKFLETAWSLDPLRGEADYDIDREDILEAEPSLFPGMDKPKKTKLFEQHLEKELLAGRLPDTGALYDFVLQQGFLIKHAMPVMRRLLKERRIHGNISHIEYSSLKKPELIRLIRK